MTATKRQIDAYRKRLAKIEFASQLTPECIQAVATVYADPACKDEIEGSLVAYTHRLGIGLLGMRLITDVVVCTDCAHRQGSCSDESRVELLDVVLVEVVRNGDRERVAS